MQKPKKARSQKQIESLAKAREARAKKLAEKKAVPPPMEQPQGVTPTPKAKPKKQRKIVFENEDESSDEEVIVIKNKRKKKKQPRVVYQQDTSSEEEEEYAYAKTNYANYQFL